MDIILFKKDISENNKNKEYENLYQKHDLHSMPDSS
jgi:hypothetical protein